MEQEKIHIKRAFAAGKMAAEKGNDPETIARLMMRVYDPTLRWDTLGDSQQQKWLEFANKFPKADKPFDEEDRIKENILSFKVNKPIVKQKPEQDKQSLGYKHLFKQPGQEPKPNEKHYRGWAEYDKEMNPEEVEESRIMDRNARINAYYVSTKGQRHRVAENIPYYLLDKLVSLLTKKYSITMNDIEVRPADVSQYRRTYQPELKEGKFNELSVMIDDYYNMSLSDVKFYGMYGITRQQFAKDYAQYLDKPNQLDEFAPAGGSGNIPRGPKTPNRGPWDDNGEDPYELRRYSRSIDFFDQFDSDGVDKQNFDKATGEYEGYYFDRDAASGITQIAYFKFDDPTKIGDNDPGVGWYYEPIDESVAEGLNEFAPPGSNDGGDDGFSEETLKRLAAQWYNGDEDPRVERTLMAAGWEIGQDEGYDDEPGVFVVQSGDTNGDSYLSWPAHELRQPMNEDYLDE